MNRACGFPSNLKIADIAAMPLFFGPGAVGEDMSGGVPATDYHQRTKHSPESIRAGPGLDFDNKPLPYKIYSDLPRIELPEDPPKPKTSALDAIAVNSPEPPTDGPFEDRDSAEINRELLAQLCHYAAGITKTINRGGRNIPFRAAACTGALYHVDLYPVCGELEGLEAGVYHFDPRSMALDVLRKGDFRGVLAEASDDDHVATAPITVVATSTWWRNAWKYRDRTFRHAFWDSGTILANLLAVAHARGLPASVVLGFADDPVVDLLGLDPADEAPLELVPIGEGSPVPDAPPIEPIDPDTRPLSPDPKEYPLIHRAWQAGVLQDGREASEWRDHARGRAPIGTRERGDGERFRLDPMDRKTATSRSLGRTIVRRGSCREYAREAISFRELSTVLDRAVRRVPIDIRRRDSSGGADSTTMPPLLYNDTYVIVNAVDDLLAGVYHYHPSETRLEQIKRGEFRREAGHLALNQRLGADAAACVYFVTDLDAITDELGDRGYRVAQFEAAITAGRFYLATYAHRNLGGTGLTFFDDAVTEFLSPRAAEQTPMFLYTLGRPA